MATAGSFAIYDSDALTSLAGMEALTTLEGCLAIYDSDNLTSLDGLSGIRSLQCIFIGGNTALESISALEGITEFTGDTVYIYSNPSLCDSVVDDFIVFMISFLPGSSWLHDMVSGNADC